MSQAVEARRVLRTCRSGALATLSARLNGHPFASVVPFMTAFDASPIVLISRLAEHTKNIAFDPRVSLMVHEPNADIQSAARLTIAGTCTRIDPDAPLRERYLKLFPGAVDLLALDFDFHRIAPIAFRYIGGFGKIHWLSPESFADAGGIDDIIERTWLRRLNSEHAQVLRDEGTAIALDCDGIDIACEGGVRRIAFTRSVKDPQAIAAAIDDLRERART